MVTLEFNGQVTAAGLEPINLCAGGMIEHLKSERPDFGVVLLRHSVGKVRWVAPV